MSLTHERSEAVQRGIQEMRCAFVDCTLNATLAVALVEYIELLERTRLPFAPYLSDRVDGVKGHYLIARWNPEGFREVWNLVTGEWSRTPMGFLTYDQAIQVLRGVVLNPASCLEFKKL